MSNCSALATKAEVAELRGLIAGLAQKLERKADKEELELKLDKSERQSIIQAGILGAVTVLTPRITSALITASEAQSTAGSALGKATSALSKIAGLAAALAALAASVATLLVLGSRVDALERYVDAVSHTASTALNQALSALGISKNAKKTADSASETAGIAKGTAERALGISENARLTANNALETAGIARSTANNALSTSRSAKTTAESALDLAQQALAKKSIPGAKGEKGERGVQGIPGIQGIPGVAGINGKNGTNGRDGFQGIQGIPGRNGRDGNSGRDGKDGRNGTNADPRIVNDLQNMVNKLWQETGLLKKSDDSQTTLLRAHEWEITILKRDVHNAQENTKAVIAEAKALNSRANEAIEKSNLEIKKADAATLRANQAWDKALVADGNARDAITKANLAQSDATGAKAKSQDAFDQAISANREALLAKLTAILAQRRAQDSFDRALMAVDQAMKAKADAINATNKANEATDKANRVLTGQQTLQTTVTTVQNDLSVLTTDARNGNITRTWNPNILNSLVQANTNATPIPIGLGNFERQLNEFKAQAETQFRKLPTFEESLARNQRAIQALQGDLPKFNDLDSVTKALSTNVGNLSNQVTNLNNSSTNTNNRITNLSQSIAATNTELDNLSNTVTAQATTIQNLSESDTQINTSITAINGDLENLQDRDTELATGIDSLTNTTTNINDNLITISQVQSQTNRKIATIDASVTSTTDKVREQERVNAQALEQLTRIEQGIKNIPGTISNTVSPTLADIQTKVQNMPVAPTAAAIAAVVPFAMIRSVPLTKYLTDVGAAANCRTAQPGGCVGNQFQNLKNTIGQSAGNIINATANGAELLLLRQIDAKLGAQVAGGIGGKLTKFMSWAIVDRVTNLITMMASVHNAMMLSHSIKESFFDILDNCLNIGHNVAPKIFSDADGSAIDARQTIGSKVDNYFKSLFGATEWAAIKLQWASYSTIARTSAQAFNNLREIHNDSQELMNQARNYTAELGNALVDEGVIGEGNWNYKDETKVIKSRKLSKLTNNLNALDDKLQAIQTVTASVLNITNTAKELQDNIKEINTAIKGANDAAKKDRNAKVEGLELPNFSLDDLF